MFDAAPLRFRAASLAAVLALAGCTTPQVEPKPSQAVAEARAHRNAPPTAACPQAPLNTVSPVMVGFAFNESEMTEATSRPLIGAAQWIGCHPTTRVVLKPDADTHGTAADQDALARSRAERVRDFLTTHGVAADRIQILRRGETEPTGDVFLIRAEGRRW